MKEKIRQELVKIITGSTLWCVGKDGHQALSELVETLVDREHIKINKIIEVLEEVISTINNSEHWWMDCPDRGGFDIEKLETIVTNIRGKQ